MTSRLQVHSRNTLGGRVGTWRLLLSLAFLVALGQPQTVAALSMPPGLPDHFGFGLEAGQGDAWMPQSGIPWDYRYQYLAGGVNTGHGWETWNSPTGAFATQYMHESASHHYIPALVYYDMLQSSGSCTDCGEVQTDLS